MQTPPTWPASAAAPSQAVRYRAPSTPSHSTAAPTAGHRSKIGGYVHDPVAPPGLPAADADVAKVAEDCRAMMQQTLDVMRGVKRAPAHATEACRSWAEAGG